MTETQEPVELVDVVIGENVHALLWKSRMSQKKLAAALDVTASVLSKKLRGKSGWSASQVSIAAGVLGVEPGDLYVPLVGPAGLEPATYGLVVPNFPSAA